MNKRTIALIISIVFVIALIAAGTYAYWIWNSDVNKNVVFNTISGLEDYVVYDEGESSFVGNFQATDSFCQSTSTTISFYKKSELADVGLSATVYMDVNSIGTNISASSDVYWVLTAGDNSISCDNGLFSDNVINYGTFNNVSSGASIVLIEELEVELTEQFYTVWIWIDNTSGNALSSLSGGTIDTNIWTEISMIPGNISIPKLDTGMIPVTISEDGVVTTIDKNDPSWYDYESKQWANVVLVSDSSRGNYMNTSGIIVPESDILAYYVWIPRYKYKVWTTSVSSAGNEQTIDIVFEYEKAAYSQGNAVSAYKTHPAFWWDNDNDGVVDKGEMIAGFWVGKFETTGTAASPTIKPGVQTDQYKGLGSHFATSKVFTSNGNSYGLSSTSTNSHVMKNREWGAVAYLSHSKYGINREIYINNASGRYTGRSGGNVGGSVKTVAEQFSGATSTNQYNLYGYYTWLGQIISSGGTILGFASDRTLGTYASTTGNVSGIYDMSGGVVEYVMGNYNNTISSSSLTAMPASKYYDKYTSMVVDSYSLSEAGGHALKETKNWHSDNSSDFSSSSPWLVRGGMYSSGASAGIFAYASASGTAYAGYHFGWRSVLIIGFNE